MMRRIPVLFLMATLLLWAATAAAQDTLPNFSLSAKPNGKVIISWHNSFGTVTQISIQRSTDSLKNFTTLISVPDPVIQENGFVDSKVTRLNMYYRLFIVLQNGNYIFSKSRRAWPDSAMLTVKKAVMPPAKDENDNVPSRVDNQRITYRNSDQRKLNMPGQPKIQDAPKVEIDKIVFVRLNDSVVQQLHAAEVRKFRDSVIAKTKDTLVFVNADTIVIKTFVPKEVYRVSNYVFITKDGNIGIALPDADRKKYTVKFLEQDLTMLLELKDIKQTALIVDKTNFLHAGWFRFELYEDGKLKEKNKLLIPKDF